MKSFSSHLLALVCTFRTCFTPGDGDLLPNDGSSNRGPRSIGSKPSCCGTPRPASSSLGVYLSYLLHPWRLVTLFRTRGPPAEAHVRLGLNHLAVVPRRTRGHGVLTHCLDHGSAPVGGGSNCLFVSVEVPQHQSPGFQNTSKLHISPWTYISLGPGRFSTPSCTSDPIPSSFFPKVFFILPASVHRPVCDHLWKLEGARLPEG